MQHFFIEAYLIKYYRPPLSIQFYFDPSKSLYGFKCILGHCIFVNKNIYISLTSTTLLRQLTLHLFGTSKIAHLKNIPALQLNFGTFLPTMQQYWSNKIANKDYRFLKYYTLEISPKHNKMNFETNANILRHL